MVPVSCCGVLGMEGISCWCQSIVQVVPTDYMYVSGVNTHTNQYSVTENFRESGDITGGRSLPGVFFFYDLSPIKVCTQQ